MHGSYSNPSERPRRAAVVNVFADGTLSNSDEALLDGVPVIPKGQPLTVRFALSARALSCDHPNRVSSSRFCLIARQSIRMREEWMDCDCFFFFFILHK